MILDKESEIIGGGDKADSARKLITKIVNALTSMREIGGPAVCSYLLGIPDHYTNKRFKVVYWYSYLKRVLDDTRSTQSAQIPSEDTLLLSMDTSKHRVVGSSKLCDYIFRPEEFTGHSLCDYLREVDVVRLSKRRSLNAGGRPAFSFRSDHPLYKSHGVSKVSRSAQYVLNFTGGILPRKDRGDRELYCATMLVLFAPGGWRRGQDLLGAHGTWHAAFEACNFSLEHKGIMGNMNVLYECTDARDDYSAMRRAAEGVSSQYLPRVKEDIADEMPDGVEFSYTEKDLLDLIEDSACSPNLATMRKMGQIEDMKRLLVHFGYGSYISGTEGPDNTSNWNVTWGSMDSWKERLTIAKQRATDLKRSATRSEGDQPISDEIGPQKRADMGDADHVDAVYIVGKEDIRDSHMAVDSPIQDGAIKTLVVALATFSLNEEQQRAFMIIAYKVHHHDLDQLKMYLGGMGGTGKSQVLCTLVYFMKIRGESRRLFVMAPTGSSASNVDGSTYHSALCLGR
ncbi:hypothetical protein C8Q79DRAFT_914293, partial [Trametes meyenii]